MRVGFTGTQIGMSLGQREQFGLLIFDLDPDEFHHGDCIGADSEAHDIVRMVSPKTKIIIHPPVITNKRAYKDGDIIHETYDYITRNHNIVDQVEHMIATPSPNQEEIRSGTWATVRYSRKQNKNLQILQR